MIQNFISLTRLKQMRVENKTLTGKFKYVFSIQNQALDFQELISV